MVCPRVFVPLTLSVNVFPSLDTLLVDASHICRILACMVSSLSVCRSRVRDVKGGGELGTVGV